MRRQILLILFGIITFCVGVCFVYLTYFRASEQKSNSIALTQNSNNPNWGLLLSFENKDLTKIDKEDEKKLRVALNQIGAEINNSTKLGTFSKISNAQGNYYYALLSMISSLGFPGNCKLQIQLFNIQGQPLKLISFNNGWRLFLDNVKVEIIPDIGREIIVVQSQRGENGRDIAKQYYGLVNEDILLIRLENSEGKLIPNRYYASNHTIGITPPQRSEEQWINSLKSTDIVELLDSLEFLGGDHQGDIVWVGGNHPKIKTEETKFIDKLRGNETVKSKIFEFANSDNKWLRDSANLVLNGED